MDPLKLALLRPEPRRATAWAAAALVAAGLAGCGSFQSVNLVNVFRPYRVEIVQGNVVTKEQMALIKPGSTRLQVRDALGTPLLADPFHANRWDYIFTLRRPGTELQRRSVVVLFDGDVVKSVEAPDLPTEQEFVASISRYKDIKPPPLELNDEERLALPLPVKRESPADEPVGPVRDYPPLERS